MTKTYKLKFKIILTTEDKKAYQTLKDEQAWIETHLGNELIKLIEGPKIDYVI